MTDSGEIKRMPVDEFRQQGFLHEINRQVLHPAGLALEIIVDDETGEESMGGVWDYRDDPEGMLFASGEIKLEKIESVEAEQAKHDTERKRRIGQRVQRPD